ncbi:MAG: hypothetical protein IT366_14060 [Candidatus Hydrogenedentes bacterium]|nr:hypothetical protein [Candidatus Hydrogenedentota bacterium]
MTYNETPPISSILSPTETNRPVFHHVNSASEHWRLVGRARQEFIRDMRRLSDCPVNLFYWDYDPMAQQLARDIQSAMTESDWNVSLRPDAKKLVGIKIVTRSPQLHAEEIADIVTFFRAAGFETKVRIRPDLETESIQMFVGSMPGVAHA